jgi:hypothetical protein
MRSRLGFVLLVSGIVIATGVLGLTAPSPRVYGQEATALDAPKWQVGDRWTWQHGTDRITWTVLAASGDYTVLSKSVALGERRIHIGLDFSSPDLQNSLLHDMSLQFPLTVGKQWTYWITSANMVPNSGKAINFRIERKVEKLESITVPAGTFDSVRIDGHQCANAPVANVTNGALPAGTPNCLDFVTWYAPKIKQVVEIIRLGPSYWWGQQTGSQILVSYNLQNPETSIPNALQPMTLLVPSDAQPARSGGPIIVSVQTGASARCHGVIVGHAGPSNSFIVDLGEAGPGGIATFKGLTGEYAAWQGYGWGNRGPRTLTLTCTFNGVSASREYKFEVQ